METLSLLSYDEGPDSHNVHEEPSQFARWVLLLKEPTGETVFHIIQDYQNQGKAIFQSWPYDSLDGQNKFLHQISLGSTPLSVEELNLICEEITRRYRFYYINHIYLNWCAIIAEEAKLESPSFTSNGGDRRLYLVRLDSFPSELIGL